jgi:hypothetical protein
LLRGAQAELANRNKFAKTKEWSRVMNLVFRIFFYFFIKSFLKKMLVGIALFLIAYFGMDEMKILKSVIGQQEYEIAQQMDIEMQKSEFGSERVLRYRMSNTGIRPVSLKLNIQSKGEKIDYKQADIFKIYSVSADQRSINVSADRPYQNYLILSVSEISAGLGLELYFLDIPSNQNYLNNLKVEIDSPESLGLYVHGMNYSPVKIMTLRLSLLFLICLATSSILFMAFGFISSLAQGVRELPSVD